MSGVKLSILEHCPVFVVGVPRSGTTLIYNILSKHSAFKGTRNNQWIAETSIFDKYIKYTDSQFEHGSWPDWNEYFYGDKVHFKEFQKDSIKSFLVNAATARSSKRILEKTPNHIESLDLIFETFPESKVICIVRHPVDVFASMRKRAKLTPGEDGSWLKISPEAFAIDYNRKIESTSFYNKKKIYMMKYEELTHKPKQVLKDLFIFINENYESNLIFGEKPANTKSVFPFRSNVPMPNSNVWHGYLSLSEVLVIQNICLSIMKKFNYQNYA